MQIDPDQPGILETGFESPKLLDGSPGNKVHRSRRHDICLLQNLLRLQYCFMLAAGGRNFHNMNALSFRTQSYKNTRTTTSLTRNYCTQNPAVQWYDPEGVRTSMVANHGQCCVLSARASPNLSIEATLLFFGDYSVYQHVLSGATQIICAMHCSCPSACSWEECSHASALPRVALRRSGAKSVVCCWKACARSVSRQWIRSGKQLFSSRFPYQAQLRLLYSELDIASTRMYT